MSEAEDTVEYARQIILVPILHSPADMGAMAAATEGCSGADLSAICNKAALMAIREYLETPKGKAQSCEGFAVGKKQMEQAQRMIQQRRAS